MARRPKTDQPAAVPPPTAAELYRRLAPLGDVAHPRALSVNYRALAFSPTSVGACSPWGAMRIRAALGLQGDIAVEGTDFLAQVKGASDEGEAPFTLQIDGHALRWRCGQARGSLPQLDATVIAPRNGQAAQHLVPGFGEGLELGALACAASALSRSAGLEGVQLYNRNGHAYAAAADSSMVSACCLGDALADGEPGLMATLKPEAAALLAEVTQRRTPAEGELAQVAAFKDFHQANSRVYARFQHYALQDIGEGRRPTGMGVLERVRNDTGGVEVRNDWHPYYSRLFMRDYPEHRGLFNIAASAADFLDYSPEQAARIGIDQTSVYCITPEIALHLYQLTPMEHGGQRLDLAAKLEPFQDRSQVMPLWREKIAAFIKRAEGLAEVRAETMVEMTVTDGTLTLSFREAMGETEQNYHIEGGPKLSVPPIRLEARRLARALSAATELVFDYAAQNVLILRGPNEFMFGIAGRR